MDKPQNKESGIDIIKNIEKHCGENLQCTRRLRFHLEQTVQRFIDERDVMKSNISNVLNGHLTYNPKTSRTTSIPNKK